MLCDVVCRVNICWVPLARRTNCFNCVISASTRSMAVSKSKMYRELNRICSTEVILSGFPYGEVKGRFDGLRKFRF